MPKQFKEKNVVYFVFSVATLKGMSEGGLGAFISDISGAGVKLRGLSTFVSGRRTKVFCVPHDAEMFRAFAKKRGLRVVKKSVLISTGDQQVVMGNLYRWVISGGIEPAVSFSSQGEAFVYRDLFMGPA